MKSQKVNLIDLPKHLPDKIDLFVCSASFEDRCRSVPSAIDPSRVSRVLIAENENHRTLHGEHPKYLQKRFPNHEMVRLDTSRPLVTADALRDALRLHEPRPSYEIVVDITTFTHEALLMLFWLFAVGLPGSEVRYVYSRAKEYAGGEPPGKAWLSQGVANVRSVLGYPGKMVPSRRLHLVILVGFEVERAVELIRRYEPSTVSLGYGSLDDTDASAHNLNRESFRAIKSVYANAHEFRFNCYDPQLAKAAVLRQVRRVANHNVVVAALNTKPSTLGVALAALHHDSIQLCYPQAIIYNHEAYSTPGQVCYVFTNWRRNPHRQSQ
jgi:hypothetical protein